MKYIFLEGLLGGQVKDVYGEMKQAQTNDIQSLIEWRQWPPYFHPPFGREIPSALIYRKMNLCLLLEFANFSHLRRGHDDQPVQRKHVVKIVSLFACSCDAVIKKQNALALTQNGTSGNSADARRKTRPTELDPLSIPNISDRHPGAREV